MRIQIQPGLGDAIYNWPIIKELAKTQEIELETAFPEIFSNLQNVRAQKESLSKVDLRLRFHVINSPAYEQLCDKAGVYPAFDFTGKELEINIASDAIIAQAKHLNKKLCIVKEPCASGRHKEKKNMSESASPFDMHTWMIKNQDQYFYVSVGQDEIFADRLKVDKDENNQFNISELLYLCYHADAIATQIGHLAAIACAFRIPLKLFKSIGDSDARFERRKKCVIVPNTCTLLD